MRSCIRKLTKASLKGAVCSYFVVEIPPLVKKEVVHDAKDHPEAGVIQANLDRQLLTLSNAGKPEQKAKMLFFRYFNQGNMMPSAVMTGDF